MITFVCWLWGVSGRPTQYLPEHVNVLHRMLRRNYRKPMRFVVVTNFKATFDAGVEIVSDRQDFAPISSPHGPSAPSCYRRLSMFAPDAAERLGERIVSIDLDTVIVGDVTELFDRDEDFIAWRDPLYPGQINGSLMMLRAGTCPQVWESFEPHWSPAHARTLGYVGSDQAFISACLPDCPTWGFDDGIFSYRRDCKKGLPFLGRIVFHHGHPKPWAAMHVPWIAQHYI